LMVDAANMGEVSGSIAVLDWRDTTGFGPSTHLQPPSTLAEYLINDLGCQVVLMGIQPGQLEFDAPLSASVEDAVSELVEGLADILR